MKTMFWIFLALLINGAKATTQVEAEKIMGDNFISLRETFDAWKILGVKIDTNNIEISYTKIELKKVAEENDRDGKKWVLIPIFGIEYPAIAKFWNVQKNPLNWQKPKIGYRLINFNDFAAEHYDCCNYAEIEDKSYGAWNIAYYMEAMATSNIIFGGRKGFNSKRNGKIFLISEISNDQCEIGLFQFFPKNQYTSFVIPADYVTLSVGNITKEMIFLEKAGGNIFSARLPGVKDSDFEIIKLEVK